MKKKQTLNDGDVLPSVRSVAAEYRLNPMTVMKGYQELVDADLVEKRRGLGMFVMQGASDKLLTSEREKFLQEEWPGIYRRIDRLGLDLEDLFKQQQKNNKGDNS